MGVTFTEKIMALRIVQYVTFLLTIWKNFDHYWFAGTGSCLDVGEGKGKYYSLNIPLKDGIRDKPFTELFFKWVPCII